MNEQPKQVRLLTIGALARATGVPAETLRTWERRYGFPSAERTSTGHRRYSLSALDRLRLVLAVIQRGHRPSVALVATEAELQLLLGQAPTFQPSVSNDLGNPRDSDRALACIRDFDGQGLE